MRYLLIILLFILLPGDDPPRKKQDTIKIQQQQAIEQTKRSRAIMDSLNLDLKKDTTRMKPNPK